jgi:hypothetical protein
MFGKLADAREEQQRVARGERILGYHPALEDTLLGWRIMQADVLIIHPDACELPSEDGRYLLGAGEQRWLGDDKRPDVASHSAAYRRMGQLLNSVPRKFTSYVICDHEREVQISVDAGTRRVLLTGNPYWYCWRRKIQDPATLRDLQAKANARANEVMQAEFQKDQRELPPAEVMAKWTPAFQRRYHGEIFDKITSANLVQPLPELSRLISSREKELNAINPFVYQSLVTTMRFAALFRHVRRENPEGYARFLDQLAAVRLTPGVETPCVMIPSEG